jgi:predicted transcriptional regulator
LHCDYDRLSYSFGASLAATVGVAGAVTTAFSAAYRTRGGEKSAMSNTVTIDLEDDAGRALDRLAQQTNRSVDALVNQAVRDYLNLQEWQWRKIEAGIAAAERGEFATEEELDRIAGKYPTRR